MLRRLCVIVGTSAALLGAGLFVTGTASAAECNVGTCVVHSGDTLSGIGRQVGVDWQSIYNANRDQMSSPDALRVGQRLVLPRGTGDASGSAAGFSSSEDTVAVAPGSTLSSIGAILGYSWQSIYAANRDQLSNPNQIYPGMILRLPR
jgi:nucleoid-associated protein YgaU